MRTNVRGVKMKLKFKTGIIVGVLSGMGISHIAHKKMETIVLTHSQFATLLANTTLGGQFVNVVMNTEPTMNKGGKKISSPPA